MRFTQAEKMEIIRLVEGSSLPVKQTLREMDVPRSSFYRWYRRYLDYGYDGLATQPPHARRFWNKIPDSEKRHVVDEALKNPELTPRGLAWHITDSQGAFISESSVYRILRDYDLVASPAYIVLTAADEFRHKTRRVHESLDNLTPADVYHGRGRDIITARNLIKEQTMRRRRRHNLGMRPLNEQIIRPEVYRECAH